MSIDKEAPGEVARGLERARKELLDLSGRNTLLNFRLPKARGVEVVGEDSAEIYRRLVSDRKAMTFAAAPTISDGDDLIHASAKAASTTDSKLQTPHPKADLEKRLLGTFTAAKTGLEERGINLLHLALGFLVWREREDATQERRAPLILIPVEMSRMPRGFQIRWTDEEVAANESLSQKLKMDFSLNLPGIEDMEELDPTVYFETVSRMARDMQGWRVEKDAISLSLLSFAKLQMYKDLAPGNWGLEVETHEVVAGLLRKDYGIAPGTDPIEEDSPLDVHLPVSETYHIRDADSSQIHALLEAKRGRTLVIQGPPGTGKSQTITNVIAELIASGKRILFVAEKMAALEVVKRRLDECGVGVACLELHSNKIKKKLVLDQLRAAAEAASPRPGQFDASAYEKERGRLNQYVRDSNTPVGRSERTPYQLIGEILQIRSSPGFEEPVPLKIPEAPQWNPSEFNERAALVQDWQTALERCGPPGDHPFQAVEMDNYFQGDSAFLRNEVNGALAVLRETAESSSALAQMAGAKAPEQLDQIALFSQAVSLQAGQPGIREDAWLDSAASKAHDAFGTVALKWWRYFSIRYWQAARWAKAITKHPGPSDLALWREMANAIVQFQQAVRKLSAPLSLSPGVTSDRHGELLPLAQAASQLSGKAKAAQEKVIKRLQVRFPNDRRPVTLRDWTLLFQSWADHWNRLDDWCAYKRATKALQQAGGLDAALMVGDGWKPGSMRLSDRFRYSYAIELLRQAYAQRPVLASFHSDSHMETVKRFKILDKESMLAAQKRLASVLVRGAREYTARQGGATVTREMQKKMRHLPLRRLMGECGPAVQARKPVFMMSPLSVAAFIPRDGIHFDCVIFDEASQVRPADALGALLRARQAVVVGDSRQMPPTSFFDSASANEEMDEEEDRPTTEGLDSILDMFCASNAPSRMLRWHYRSRCPSLIAVSNYHFYDNKLLVFPSPGRGQGSRGLVLRHLPSTEYDRGKSKTNRGEAEAIATAVLDHMRTRPTQTIGVVAFSQSQEKAVRDALENLAKNDAELESFIYREGPESFFVKNLENVQGDERDVILISIGYGRDASGKLTMNFGPLNRNGGERRLNVLITRARHRCEVFTNLLASDIRIDETAGDATSVGLRALKSFLHYAETGSMDVALPSGKEPQSPFEEAVKQAIESLGYQVDSQVGSAGYFIDLAVCDPSRPGTYLLGVECDGATYHSARTARDRDRLRQGVLESLGWKIHRVWSSNWWSRPDHELERLKAMLASTAAPMNVE